jgi:hypothetical protein
VTMSCGISIVTKQCERRRYYGNGVCWIRESFIVAVEFWNAKGKDAVVVRVFEEL